MTIVEKAAYLKGLTDGFALEPESRDCKLWGALNDRLGDVAHKLEELEQGMDAHEEALDDVYEQLIELQEITLPDEDWSDWEDYEDEDAEEEGPFTPALRLYDGKDADKPDEDDNFIVEDGEDDGNGEEEEDEEIEYDGVLYEVTCPGCGETITFGEDTLEDGRILCPSCGETLEFDLGENE